MIALTEAKHALNTLKTRPLHVLLSCVVDIAFLFLYGFITQFPRDQAFSAATKLEQVFSQLLANASTTYDTPSMLRLFFDRLALPHVLNILFWLFVLLLILYILYALFQGFAWKLAAGTDMVSYAKLSAFWLAIIGVLYLCTAIIDMRAILVQSLTQQPASQIPHIVFQTITIILLYFFTLATGLLKDSWKHANKNAFHLGTRGILNVIPAAALLIGVVLVLNAFLMWLFNQHQLVGVIVGVLTIFPGLFLARVYISFVTEKLHARQHA
jgi:hypothetical protein